MSARGSAAVPAFAALVFLAPLTMLPGGTDPSLLPQSLLVQCSAWALLALALGKGAALDARVSPPLLALPFLAWAALSLLWATNPYAGLPQASHWLACALLGWLAGALLRGPADVARVQAAAFASGAVVAALGLAQALLRFGALPQAVAPAATFMHKNLAAEHVVLTLPFACGLAFSAGRRLRLAVSAAAAAMALFVLLTLTRAAWLALAVQAILLAVLVRRRWPEAAGLLRAERRAAALALAVAVALGLAAIAVSAGLRERLGAVPARLAEAAGFFGEGDGRTAPYSSVRHRRAIWLNTLDMVRDAPVLGTGLANHRVMYPLYAKSSAPDLVFGAKAQLDYVHNDYLQVLAELGGVGWVLALGFLVPLGLAARASLVPPDAGRGTLPLAVGSILSLAGLLVVACFSFPLESAIPPLLAMVNAGMLGLLARAGAPAPERPGRGHWRRPAAAAAGAVCLLLLWHAVSSLQADRRALGAARAEARRDWAAAAAESQAALARAPHRRDALFLFGRARFFAGDLEAAVRALEAYLELWPYDMNALGDVGLAYARLGQPRQALERFQRVLRIDPEDALAHHEAAKALERLSDLDRALEEHRLAVRYGPLDAVFRYRHGVAAMRAGRIDEARVALAEALELDPGHALAHKAFGVLLSEVLGDKEQGRAHLKRALELDPSLPDGERMRALIAR